MQSDWKFHDFDMLPNGSVKVLGKHERFGVVYRLTNLPTGSRCFIYPYGHDGDVNTENKRPWMRKTRNAGKNGSTRYTWYPSLNAAMDAAIKWARRKDEEAAREGRA